jgi:pilus assembly protein CpaF
VSSALDLVIQIERLEDGNRRITSISEVQRMESEVITMQELFTWKMEQVTGERVFVGNLVSTGLRPTFLNKFEKRGIALPTGLFHENGPSHSVSSSHSQ